MDYALPFGELEKLSLGELLVKAMPIVDFGLSATRDVKSPKFRHRLPTIVCRDGTTLSVQAGPHNYSTPTNFTGPYRAVEVGYPSRPVPDTWAPYADADFWTHGVSGPELIFAYIPIELVHFYIAAHGGIDHARTFNNGVVEN